MAELQFKRLEWEQKAYNVIRQKMSEEFLVDPPGFMRRVGCRPEYMSPEQLRDQYRNMVVAGVEVHGERGFVRSFQAGSIFP